MTAVRAVEAVRVEAAAGFYRGRFDAMASGCEVLCETDDADAAAYLVGIVAAETRRIEEKFSRYRAGNVVHRINRASGRPVEVDPETADLIDFAEELYRLSDGRFDITSGALRRAWQFDGSDRVPSTSAINAVLPAVGWHRVDWRRPVLTLPQGMEIDLGGIGKEYAVDRAAARVRDASDRSCLVNLGGDLAVTRTPERLGYWRVGIESRHGARDIPARLLRLSTGALATSGDARRFVEKDGKRFGHILDPTTGWPVAGAPAAVTVAADTCTQAGMLATLAMLEGEGAERFLDAQMVAYWCARPPARPG